MRRVRQLNFIYMIKLFFYITDLIYNILPIYKYVCVYCLLESMGQVNKTDRKLKSYRNEINQKESEVIDSHMGEKKSPNHGHWPMHGIFI